ncbi:MULTISPECIES: MarR family winged helix-turn-helix transcriptional regulator [Flavobacterium]|uniref:MarR family transcriptional regulator n=1 Tax=Flavobacterium sedimenticola TaxID=3043286 RepID=A0ABT6XLU7_9FLAO|nr:MarR family transcriptional regulator [Flavobacterium sedimenticola]MDI9256059.1 MarR family transcriptional regulator [Flavobacterium sedimenticola]
MEKLDDIIFYKIDKAIRSYRMFAQRQLKTQGYKISVDQWLVIKAILENPGMPQQEIAAVVFKDNASVTRIIEILVQSGYLRRNTHETDRRKTSLEVTENGRDIIQSVQSLVQQNRKVALKGVSESELQNMYQTLNKIIDNCP